MKKIFSFTIAVFSLIAVLESCQSASKTSGSTTLLKMNLEKGKGYDYDMNMAMNLNDGTNDTKVDASMRYSMAVTSIEEGVRTVETSYNAIHLFTKVPGIEIDIDTDNPGVDNGKNSMAENPIGLMTRMFQGLVNKKFTVKINEEGKVLKVQGFDRIIDGMVDSLGLTGQEKATALLSLKSQFSDQVIKDQFAQMFYIFPNKEVKVGDSWEKSYETGGNLGAGYTTTYTVKEIEGTHVTLSTDTKITGKEGGNEMNGVQTGNLIVDSKTGLMINGDFKQDIKSSSKGKPVTVKGNVKVKGSAR